MNLLKLKLSIAVMLLASGVGLHAEQVLVQSSSRVLIAQVTGLKEAERLNQKVIELYEQGKYDEAFPLAEQVLAIRKRLLGDRHSHVATSLDNLAEIYRKQGQYEKAEPLYLQALELYKSLLGDRHPDVATSLDNLARLYQDQGRYEKAEPLVLQALELRKSLLSDRHPDVATSLINLAELYRKQGRYEKAEPLYLQGLELYKSLLGNRHRDVATSLDNLARLYRDQGRYEKAEPLLVQALELYKSLLGNHHPDVATSLNNLAGLYQNQGRYDEAEPLLLQALALYKSRLGDRHPSVATSLINLALLYLDQGQYGKAEPLFLQALELYKSLLGDHHPNVATSLMSLAELYRKQGRYEKAELLALQALELRKSWLGDRHPSVATSLINLSTLYRDQGRYEKAELLALQALELYKSLLGDRHPDVAISLTNLSTLYLDQGKYEKAETLYLQALELTKSLLGDRHPRVADSLNNLAGLYREQGRYEKAEPLLLQALELRKSLLGDRHPAVTNSLNNLAGLYWDQGRYEKAELLALQALELRKSLLGDRHPAVASSLNNLATLYRDQGRYEKAEPFYLKALELRKSLLGDRHPDVASSLNELAELYRKQGRYSSAEPLFLQALELRKLLLGDRHPNVAASLNNLALLYRDQGRYEKAEPLFLQALELAKSLLGDRHPDVSTSLNNLALLYQSQEQYEKALDFLTQGMQIEETNLATNIAIGAERQKLDFLRKFNGTIDESISLHLQRASANPKAIHLAFTNILRRKGRILDTLTDSLTRIRQNLTPPDQVLLDKLSAQQTRLATLYHTGRGNLSPEQYRALITELEQQSTQLAEALSRRSATFKTATQPTTLENTQQQIPPDTALIELIQYQPFDPKAKPQEQWGKPHYAAYILTHSGLLKGVDLGPVQPVNAALISHRQNLQDKATPIPQLKASGQKLDALLMQPLRPHLGTIRNLLLSPDSALNLLPFESLVDEQGRYLLETNNITYLTSGRDLRRFQNPKPNNNPALILADPYFDKPGTLAATSLTQRTINLAQKTWPPLQGTATEAKAIAPLLDTQPHLSTAATETLIKQTQSPKILHLATHGFFQPTIDSTTNPLLNSGLVFAGFRIGKSGNDDGILTALEVSNLNLANTKLVTLSACDTGLGTITTGEGIYGLRRALVIAGAESQVISLWKVADDATKDLMINYYTRLKKGGGRSVALHQAQRDMLKSEKYSHPYYWAAFIPSGDWRPLD
jgi:tetratricopeptide (TPR) repeat protein